MGWEQGQALECGGLPHSTGLTMWLGLVCPLAPVSSSWGQWLVALGGLIRWQHVVCRYLGRHPRMEELALLVASGIMVRCVLWLGLSLRSCWGRCWPGLPELLVDAVGRELSETSLRGPHPVTCHHGCQAGAGVWASHSCYHTQALSQKEDFPGVILGKCAPKGIFLPGKKL